jgi:molybdopterin-guanine dinucleotide biosynthesis protein A
MLSPITVAILAGGQSRRMGTDKSFVLLNDKPLIQHVIDRARQLDYPLMLIANDVERYRQFDLPVYPDVISGAGSLGGLYTALTHSQTDYTLCLACDMPQINPALLRYLIGLCADYDVIVPLVDNVTQALHAVYHKRCLPVMQKAIEQNNLRIRNVLSRLQVRFVYETEVKQFDPCLTSFANINTPDDLRDIHPQA